MVDLHCHILPQVDDGAGSLDEALAMARIFAAEGVAHVVATPHCHRYTHLLRADVLPQVERLNLELQSAGVPVTILPGSEIQVTDTTAYRREYDAGLFCHLGDGQDFTLLEFNWERELYPPDAVQLVAWLCGQGMTPILAHPERITYFWSEPALLQGLVGAGAWLQITADSLIGNHGPAPRVSGQALLQKYPQAVLASDSHNLKRCSGLSPGYAWVTENLGKERSQDLQNRADQVLSRLLAVRLGVDEPQRVRSGGPPSTGDHPGRTRKLEG